MSSNGRPENEQRFQRCASRRVGQQLVPLRRAVTPSGRAPVDGRPGRWTSALFGHHGRSAYRISNNASCPVLIWLDNPTAKSDAIQSTTVDRSDQGQLGPGAMLTMGVVRLDGKFALDGAILENSEILLTLSAPANAVFLPCAEGRLFASHLYAG
ncbi:putative transposase [Trichinella spiralis]|uniref:putative transposase n=1 Tax=Trichinella spiralis TaxID=6334 RepID=UPI0001EFC469|nr:putative transposase [Trichinella spiralis]